jgi:ribosomal-protein-alanine N-acetyltransferase
MWHRVPVATTRLLGIDDVPALTELLARNRDFLEPWEPTRAEEFFTEEIQAVIVEEALEAYDAGTMVPLAILDTDGALAGRLNLNGIVRGAFQSTAMGYWVSQDRNGQGLATRAVQEAVGLAFGELGLHRVQAETLLHNEPSQRVLARAGFTHYGLAPKYLKIAGRWQDCLLFQRINEE